MMKRNIWLNSSIGICMTLVVLMTFSSTNCLVRDNLNDNNNVEFAEDRTFLGGGESEPIFGEEEPGILGGMIPPLPILIRKTLEIIVSIIVDLSGFINDSYGIFILSNEFISFINGTMKVCAVSQKYLFFLILKTSYILG